MAEAGGRAVIMLWRALAWRDVLRRYEVLVDGGKIARIRPGRLLELPITPGSHEIFLRLGPCRSPSVRFDAQPYEVIRFYCEPGGPARNALWEFLSARDEWIRLVRA